MKNNDKTDRLFVGENDLSEAFASWYKASFLRFSTRKYKDKAITEKDRAVIDAWADRINVFDDGVRVMPVYDIAPDLFESFGYSKLFGVPAFLAILVTKKKKVDIKAGFYGEAMCLALTEKNIKTCWVSGSIKKQNLKAYLKVPKGERFLTSIAFGYGENQSLEVIEEKRKRKTMDKIFEADVPNDGVARVMDCVRNAPSAINRQPWRYGLKAGQLYVKKPIIPGGPFPESLDIGISMLHVSCAAKALGMPGVWRTSKDYLAVF